MSFKFKSRNGNLIFTRTMNDAYRIMFPLPDIHLVHDYIVGNRKISKDVFTKVNNIKHLGEVLKKMGCKTNIDEVLDLTSIGTNKITDLEDIRSWNYRQFEPYVKELDFLITLEVEEIPPENDYMPSYYDLVLIISTKLMNEEQKEIINQIIFESKLEGEK